MKTDKCFFVGHRNLPVEKTEHLYFKLEYEIEKLINSNVTYFISGGALGFDILAAEIVAKKKLKNKNIKLEFALPCKSFFSSWSDGQKQKYRALFNFADKITYVSNEYTRFCVNNRNLYMVNNSAYCICALVSESSTVAQIVRHAFYKGLSVVNVIEK